MLVERTARVAELKVPVATLRENCMGCEDCKGACLELFQMKIIPDMLNGLKEVRT